MIKKCLVLGAGGFIGSHLVKRLVAEGNWVRGVDLKLPEFCDSAAQEFIVADLRDPYKCREAFEVGATPPWSSFDEVYQLAADMGGAGFVFTGEHDAAIMHNSAQINLNVLEACVKNNVAKVFYSSSACMYPEHNQMNPDNPNCEEASAYPAAPDSEYGWEKLFSERMYLAYARNHGLDVRIARFHNIYGPEGTWDGGREKAPAAMCRKAAATPDGGKIEVWGDGLQTRSFLYIDECLEGVSRLMQSDYGQPVNIGSDEMIAINDFAQMAIDISGKNLEIENVDGPLGVRGRSSDNRLIREVLDWEPNAPLREGMQKTYDWIKEQVENEGTGSTSL